MLFCFYYNRQNKLIKTTTNGQDLDHVSPVLSVTSKKKVCVKKKKGFTFKILIEY
jgi:hypothetical protein